MLPRGTSYDVGDNLNILLRNSDEVVSKVIQELGLNPKQQLAITTIDKNEGNFIPPIASIEDLFTQYIALYEPPPRSLLRCYIQVSRSKEIRTQLLFLLDIKNEKALQDLLKSKTTADFILEYSKDGAPKLDLLLSAVNFIKPTCFPIYSCPEIDYKTAHIISYQDQIDSQNVSEIKKQSSIEYFLERDDVTEISIQCQPSRTPIPDLKSPIFFVATGLGISKIIALLKKRELIIQEEDSQLPPAIIFFETKEEEEASEIIKMLDDFQKKEVVKGVLYAFSNDPEQPKQSISKLIQMNSTALWEIWSSEKTILYYAGRGGEIPGEVKQNMLDLIVKEGWMSLEEAQAVNQKHTFIFDIM